MPSPEEQLNKTVSEILTEIKQEALVTPDDHWIIIPTETDDRRRAVRYLTKLQAIKSIEHTPLTSPIKLIQEINGRVYKPNSYKVEALQPKFEEIYNQYHPEEEKPTKDKLPYKKDGLFYSLWKYANAHRLTEKSLITFFDLLPLNGTDRFTIFEFVNALKELGVELENITFHTDIYQNTLKVSKIFYRNTLLKTQIKALVYLSKSYSRIRQLSQIFMKSLANSMSYQNSICN